MNNGICNMLTIIVDPISQSELKISLCQWYVTLCCNQRDLLGWIVNDTMSLYSTGISSRKFNDNHDGKVFNRNNIIYLAWHVFETFDNDWYWHHTIYEIGTGSTIIIRWFNRLITGTTTMLLLNTMIIFIMIIYQ